MKKIIVACGTGGVTSKNIGNKIESFLKSKSLDVQVSTCRILELKSQVDAIKPDLVASASELPKLNVPTVKATAILTGIGAEKVLNEIYQLLTKD